MTAISYQLYSSRNFGPIADTLKMLAAAGYTDVEGYGGLFSNNEDAAALKLALQENGLLMSSAHMGLSDLEQNPAGCVAMAELLGMKAVFVPYIEEEFRPADLAGWRAFGARVQSALAPLKEAGFTIGWHNHDFEMAGLESGIVLDAILEGGPDLSLELDLAWVILGGRDPIALLEKYAGRMAAIHIKDIAQKGECADEDGWQDVGYGTVDWVPIRDAVNNTSTRFVVAEHDNPNDDKRFAVRSLAAVKALWNA